MAKKREYGPMRVRTLVPLFYNNSRLEAGTVFILEDSDQFSEDVFDARGKLVFKGTMEEVGADVPLTSQMQQTEREFVPASNRFKTATEIWEAEEKKKGQIAQAPGIVTQPSADQDKTETAVTTTPKLPKKKAATT